MKKLAAFLLSAVLLVTLVSCSESEPIKKEEESLSLPFESLKFSFCSGAGAWSTELVLKNDGTFTGFYSDSDMGSFTDEYPDGTNYVCEFSGNFKNITKINDYTYSFTLDEVITAKEFGEEWIEDSIRYIASPPYGIYDGREFILYTPDAPVSEMDETFLSWLPIGIEFDGEKLGKYGLHNVETGDGFFSFE
ncbi:MAG: hypothetical protein E7473_05805 [Ruminococcaceae bacterium]|nr:hypothetical protein [Oscillospiraceae bacterium]